MIRSALARTLVLALATSVAGIASVNCSGKQKTVQTAEVGTVGLALQLSPGVVVDKVDYEITGSGLPAIKGSVPVTDPGATVSLLVSGIPAGTGYKIELGAKSPDGKTSCAGSATFDVVASQTTSVSVKMQCRGPNERGSISISASFNNCPALTSFVAAPLAVSVGGTINVGAAASDADEGAKLTFAWTTTAGKFADAAAASTGFTCSAGGAQTLTVTVSDGACEDTATIPVSCVALLCGNGKVDDGETCDDGNSADGDACPSDCTLAVCGDRKIEGAETCDDGNTAAGDNCPADCTLAVCGDGAVEASESCEPPNTATCSATCQRIVGCGNGAVDAGEDCDDGNTTAGDGCSASCKAEPVCGNGKVEAPTETCEPPNTASCDAKCQTVNACKTCEQAQCPALVTQCENATGNAAAGPATGTPRKQLCLELLDCVRTSKCAAGQVEDCFCGPGVDPIACITGGATGVCKAKFEAAAETTNGVTVSERFADPNFAVGNAVRLLQCDKEFCSATCF
jgi:cysteine-rich repeat protein